MKSLVLPKGRKANLLYGIGGITVVVVAAGIYFSLVVNGVFALKTINHNRDTFVEQLSLTDVTKYEATKACTDYPPTTFGAVTHKGICIANGNFTASISDSASASLYKYLDILTAHGWKSTDVLIGTTPAEAYTDNRDAVSRVINQDAADPVDESLHFNKKGYDLELRILDTDGISALKSYDFDNLGLELGGLPGVGEDQLLLVFNQQKEYFSLTTPFHLPMFKPRDLDQ